MAQRFGPWDDAVNRELLATIKTIVTNYRAGDSEDYLDGEDVVDAIASAINDVEGTDL